MSLKAGDVLTSLTFWSKNYLSILKASRPLSYWSIIIKKHHLEFDKHTRCFSMFWIVNQPKISKCHHERWKNSWKCKVQILLQFNEFFQVYFSPTHPVILKIPFWHILKILYRILSKSIYTKQRGQSWRRKDLFFLSSSVIVCQRRWFARDAHMSLEKKNNCGSSSIQCQGSKETLNFLQRGCCQLMQITKEIQDVPTSFRHKAQFLKT